jgi:hypothetical protein
VQENGPYAVLADMDLGGRNVGYRATAHSGHRDHAFRRIAIGAKRRLSQGLVWSLRVLG